MADERLADLAEALASGADITTLGPDAAALEQILVDRGAFTLPQTTVAPPRRVRIAGDGPVASALRSILSAQVGLIREASSDETVDAIVSIDAWYRDAHWVQLAARGFLCTAATATGPRSISDPSRPVPVRQATGTTADDGELHHLWWWSSMLSGLTSTRNRPSLCQPRQAWPPSLQRSSRQISLPGRQENPCPTEPPRWSCEPTARSIGTRSFPCHM